VIVIIGALLAFAVPSYLGARDRGAQKAADANVRATLPSVAAFRGDNGNYTGMTASALRTAYDAAVSPTITLSVSGSPPNETYCVGSDVSNKSASFQGPAQASPWYSTDDCTGSALPAAP